MKQKNDFRSLKKQLITIFPTIPFNIMRNSLGLFDIFVNTPQGTFEFNDVEALKPTCDIDWNHLLFESVGNGFMKVNNRERDQLVWNDARTGGLY